MAQQMGHHRIKRRKRRRGRSGSTCASSTSLPPSEQLRMVREQTRPTTSRAHDVHGGADSLKNLDSSLKKNTAYIKRLKTSLNAADSVAVLLKESRTLSLDKYLSEIVTAASECLVRCKTAAEIWGAVEVRCDRLLV